MTTCVNQEKKGYAGKAVSATLAGVLAVGMVPASALAAVPGGSDVAEDAGVETLATTPESFAKGTLTFSNGTNAQTYEYNGSSQGLRISKVTPPAADVIEVNGIAPTISSAAKETAYYQYIQIEEASSTKDSSGVAKNAIKGADGSIVTYTNAKGKTTELYGTALSSAPKVSGEYAVVAVYKYYTDQEEWYYTNTAGYFTIEGNTLSDATLFDGADVTDTTFEYTGVENSLLPENVASRIGVAINNVSISSYVNVEIWNNGGTVNLSTGAASTRLVPGTTYIAKVTGTKAPYAGQVQDIKFTISKLDLSTAVIEGLVSEDLASALNSTTTPTYTQLTDGDLLNAGLAAYTSTDLASYYTESSDQNTLTPLTTSGLTADKLTNAKVATVSTTNTVDSLARAAFDAGTYYVLYSGETVATDTTTTSTTTYTDGATYYYKDDDEWTSIDKAGLAAKGFANLTGSVYTKNASGVYTKVTQASDKYDSTQTYYVLSFASSSITNAAIVKKGASALTDLYVDDEGTTEVNPTSFTYTDGETKVNAWKKSIGDVNYNLQAVKNALLKSINSKAWTTVDIDGCGDGYDQLKDQLTEQLAKWVDIEFVSDPKGNKTIGSENGAYTFKIKARSTAVDGTTGKAVSPTETNNYVTGEATFTVYQTGEAATISFGSNKNIFVHDDETQDSSACNTKGDCTSGYYYVNLSPAKGEDITYFDLSQITASYDTNKDIKNKDITVTITDAAGKTVDAEALKTAGTYYVTASVNDKISGVEVCGSEVAKVVVSYKVAGESDVFITYNGQNVDTSQDLGLEYTGKDQAGDLSYKVQTANGDVLVEGTDYEVVITTVIDGKVTVVDEIVDAGTYTINVKGKTYSGNADLVVVVSPAEITKITPDYDYNTNDEKAYAYTGDVITPTFKFGSSAGAKTITSDDYDVYYVRVLDANGKKVDHVSSIQYVDEDGNDTNKEHQFSTLDAEDLKAEGTYEAYFKLKDGVTNYTFDESVLPVIINVSSEKVFLDVPNGEWYTSYVYDANKAGYVYGYNNGKFFGPNDDIKRGDVVMILARMAGVSTNGNDDETDNVWGYTNPFDDVDNSMYYAKSIAWAAHVGIVTGTSETTFEPERSVTREEFVTMLQRYANLCENGAAVATDTAAELAKYTDGTSVCDWAKDAVAWASENEIMTGYAGTTVLGAENTVTRAQVAKMVVTYQPKKIANVWATL